MKTHASRWIAVSAVLVTLLAVAVGLLVWNTQAGALGQRQLAGRLLLQQLLVESGRLLDLWSLLGGGLL